MNNLSRSPLLWISATVFSGLLCLFSFHFFPKTFPLVHLDITMDMHQALEKAKNIAQEYNFGPSDYHNAVTFNTDTTAKTFVELKCGGKDALVAMMEEKLYMPYTWRVRHFKEFEKNETLIQFTPDGKKYGFSEKISEMLTGAQLTQKKARLIAETAATAWDFNLANYLLVESTNKTEPSGRIDHTFTYELRDKKIGEGLYRLEIIVSGDKVTKLWPFIKIPESFTRHYEHMRSANNTIAATASLLMMLLYIIGGCGFGLYFLMKRRWLLWKTPLAWGTFIACAAMLTSFNQLPAVWMNYHTALSLHGFFMQLCLSFFIGFLIQTLFISLCIMTAESLTRHAFGNHPQLWNMWATNTASSVSILGRTIGGYLLVGFDMAFVILFYFVSTRFFGWWTPSEMLFDPNILATYAPWFSPLALSLNAAFLEECLFRAIPLAGAALLGDRFGKRNRWIAAAFILQALIFAAAHANYPAQPAYARLIELIIPSFIWGWTYLRFGLLPTIICHFTYDIIWFSLPLFVSVAPYALLYKAIIILATMIPLGIVLYARIKKGSWSNLAVTDLNSFWQPNKQEKLPEPLVIPHKIAPLSQKALLFISGLGVFGLIAWFAATPFTHDGITITLTRNEAIEQAQTFLQQNNISLDKPWRTLAHISDNPQSIMQHKFIWEKEKKEKYHELLGTYLHPALWTIRYAQFEGDIVTRAEEYQLSITDKHNIFRFWHKLPESSAGKSLTKKQAEPIAYEALKQQYNLDSTQLKEISAKEIQHQNRKDWLFIFADKTMGLLEADQARINVLIAGDTVVDTIRSIHVPEEWERNETAKQQILSIIKLVSWLLFILCFLWILILSSRQSLNIIFTKKQFIIVASAMTGLLLCNLINQWPSIASELSTSQPLTNQIFIILTFSLFSYLMLVGFSTLAIMSTLTQQEEPVHSKGYTPYLSICGGLFIAGIVALKHKILPAMEPLWPDYAPLGSYIPILAAITNAITFYLTSTCCFGLLTLVIDKATKHCATNKIYAILFFILMGLVFTPLYSLSYLPLWLAFGALFGSTLLLLYCFIIDQSVASVLPLATGTYIVLQTIQQGIFNAYPGAIYASCISTILIGCMSIAWHRRMNN